MKESELTPSAFVRKLRERYGPRARLRRIHRGGLAGLQVLDDQGRVLVQTFAGDWGPGR